MTASSPDDPSSSEPGDDAVPRAETPASAQQAKDVLRGHGDNLDPVGEVQTRPPSGTPPLDDPPGGDHFKLLTSLVSRTLFFDYFVHVANMRYRGKYSEMKVRSLIEDSRRFYRFVLFADLALRAVTVLLVLATIGAVLWKTIIE